MWYLLWQFYGDKIQNEHGWYRVNNEVLECQSSLKNYHPMSLWRNPSERENQTPVNPV